MPDSSESGDDTQDLDLQRKRDARQTGAGQRKEKGSAEKGKGAAVGRAAGWHRFESLAAYRVCRKITVNATTTKASLHLKAIADYPEACKELEEEGVWRAGAKNPTVEWSVSERTTGKKHAIWVKGTEMKTEVVNLCTGSFNELFRDGKLPSGVLEAGALEMVKEQYYLKSLTDSKKRKLQDQGPIVMPENWTDGPWEIFLVYGPTVLGGLGDAGLLIQATDSTTEQWNVSRTGQKSREQTEGVCRLFYVSKIIVITSSQTPKLPQTSRYAS